MKFKLKKYQKFRFQRNLGNLLMLVPILVLLYIYYPLLFVYVDPPKIQPVPNKGVFIEIPKIQAQGKIIEDVNPWNEAEYREKLLSGIAHAKGSAKIGSSKGTVYLFAHSSDLPWRITRYNTAFYKLGQVDRGDKILLIKNGKTYSYEVLEKKVVWPNEVRYLKDLQKTQLILQTCTPVGTALQRLLVFAKPVKVDN
jgi:LPXTG-site transpeptidase (sortase) family protein